MKESTFRDLSVKLWTLYKDYGNYCLLRTAKQQACPHTHTHKHASAWWQCLKTAVREAHGGHRDIAAVRFSLHLFFYYMPPCSRSRSQHTHTHYTNGFSSLWGAVELSVMDLSGAVIESVCSGPEESERRRDRQSKEFKIFFKIADFFKFIFYYIFSMVAIRQEMMGSDEYLRRLYHVLLGFFQCLTDWLLNALLQ